MGANLINHERIRIMLYLTLLDRTKGSNTHVSVVASQNIFRGLVSSWSARGLRLMIHRPLWTAKTARYESPAAHQLRFEVGMPLPDDFHRTNTLPCVTATWSPPRIRTCESP